MRQPNSSMHKILFILTVSLSSQSDWLSDCMAGNGEACNTLGTMYFYGQGVPRDKKEAAIHYTKACNFNYAEACNTLGYFYLLGQDVEKNQATAKQFFKKACALGNKEACSKK